MFGCGYGTSQRLHHGKSFNLGGSVHWKLVEEEAMNCRRHGLGLRCNPDHHDGIGPGSEREGGLGWRGKEG